jgi:hypothetical protein
LNIVLSESVRSSVEVPHFFVISDIPLEFAVRVRGAARLRHDEGEVSELLLGLHAESLTSAPTPSIAPMPPNDATGPRASFTPPRPALSERARFADAARHRLGERGAHPLASGLRLVLETGEPAAPAVTLQGDLDADFLVAHLFTL